MGSQSRRQFSGCVITLLVMTDHRTADAVIWTDATCVSRVVHVLELMGMSIRPIGIGGPRLAQIGRLTDRFDCRREDDLRKLLVECPAHFVLLGSMTGVGPEDVSTAMNQGSVVLTLEPVASEFSELIRTKTRSGTGSVRSKQTAPSVTIKDAPPVSPQAVWMPRFDRSPGWTAATDPHQVLGTVQAITIGSFGQPDDCSLFARLYDAWYVVLSLGDVPEEIDASLTGPLSDIPENLRGITGHLTAHARLGNGCTAALTVSDRAGGLGRQLHSIGDQGHLRVSDTGYQLYNTKGQCIDQLAEPQDKPGFAELIAHHWSDLIRRPTAEAVPRRPTSATDTVIVACCQATLLSARTGHPESPRKLLQLTHL